jgi:hypothetical protein
VERAPPPPPAAATTTATTTAEGPLDPLTVAQRLRRSGPVPPFSESTVVVEAEELQVSTPGWRALPYGTNYYAATLANTFLSRQAYLGAPEQTPDTQASVEFVVPRAGRYLALVRYEAAYRFETRFRLRVEQQGSTRLDRLYGARDGQKVWAFKKGLATDVTWEWGAADSVVWEGTDAYVELEPGPARLTLEASMQPEPAARRNVDVIVLTSDEASVKERLAEERYLPFDGMLTQAGDVFLRVRNHGGPFTFQVGHGVEHSPYWVHLRDWKPKTVDVAAGETTDWIEVGSLLDTLSDGQFSPEAKAPGEVSYDLDVGVPDPESHRVSAIRSFPGGKGSLRLAYFGDTRYSRRIRAQADVLDELLEYLRARPVRGVPPTLTPIYGITFNRSEGDEAHAAKVDEFVRLMGANRLATSPEMPHALDVRSVPTAKLRDYCEETRRSIDPDTIDVVSLGDEITMGSPGDAAAKGKPELFYRSRVSVFHAALKEWKERTAILHGCFPNAGIGANFSPHVPPLYVGDTHQWITPFREGALTMPWSEDYVFQVPVGSPQVNSLVLDVLRAGLRGSARPEGDRPAHGKPGRIQYYVMPHDPGNTPDDWRRQFYGDLAHGAKVINLFELRPVQVAYTENHVDVPEMYQAVRVALHELGTFEDIVQEGEVLQAPAALFYSETADVWSDKRAPFGAHDRSLYLLLRHKQIPLDVVVEGDDLRPYAAIFLTDAHVSRAASRALASWVERGGQLVATAGAGMKDEFDRPNATLQALFGVGSVAVEEDAAGPVRLEKQDLPFAAAMDHVRTAEGKIIPVLSLRAPSAGEHADVVARFDDGRPAITVRRVGKGSARYVGFLPGLSYLQPGIPRRPFDRRSDDSAMCHLLPTTFDEEAAETVHVEVVRPVVSSVDLVESTVVRSSRGVIVPLINWTGHPVRGLTVSVRVPAPPGPATLASGGPVREEARGTERVFTLDLDVADAIVLR